MPSANRSPSGNHPFLPWGVVAFLLVMIAVIYGQTLGFDFLGYDDLLFVVRSQPVCAGLTGSSIAWAFTNGPLGEWYPLSMLSHMLDCQIFGLSPWGHHLTSVLLHAATTVGLFLVLRSMTGELWPSAIVATVMAVHPQHVESVAWIAERRDVLSGLFFVLTLGAYLGYVRHGRNVGRYLLVAALLCLGLMSKAMLVTVPPLLLLLDYWPLGRFGHAGDLPQNAPVLPSQSFWRLVAEKLPLVAIAVCDGAMTLLSHVGNTTPIVQSWSDRFGNAVVSLATYVFQFFYPADLAAFYPFPAGRYPAWKLAGAILALVAITVAAVFWRRKRPYLLVGWLWFLGMMVPVLGLVHVSDHAMADRYMYLPSIGLAIALAWGTARAAAGLGERPLFIGGCAALAIGLLVSQAVRQTSYWHDDLALWEHALTVTPDNPNAEVGIGFALSNLGLLDEALEHYLRAASWRVDAQLLNKIGTVLSQQQKLDEAAAFLQRALDLDPNFAEAEANLGMVLELQRRLDEAADHYRRAIELNPLFAWPHFKLGNLLLKEGQIDQAISHFEQAIVLDPTSPAAQTSLAVALSERGQIDRAVVHCRRALAIAPDDEAARRVLDKLLESQGQMPPQ